MKPSKQDQNMMMLLRLRAQELAGGDTFPDDTADSLFSKMAYANGFGHLLNIPNEPLDRARHEFKYRSQGFHRNKDELFDLVIECLTKNGVPVGEN